MYRLAFSGPQGGAVAPGSREVCLDDGVTAQRTFYELLEFTVCTAKS